MSEERKIYLDILPIEVAKRVFTSHLSFHHSVEKVPLSKARGRVLAENIFSKTEVPPFDRSSMDGFAVRAEDTYQASEASPVTLTIVDRVPAGKIPITQVKQNDAVEVGTGAPIPPGASAVVMVEDTEEEIGSNVVQVRRAVTPGTNIASAGSDIHYGELIQVAGSLVGSKEIGVLAATGYSEIPVVRPPTVAVLSSGDELVPVGEELQYGRIYDTNGHTISAAVEELGGRALQLGIARDTEEDLRAKLAVALEKADIVLISGGTSAGAGDITYRIIKDLGQPGIVVHGVAMKPGKPTALGVVNGKPLVILPGYPTSSLLSFEVFVAPLIQTYLTLPLSNPRNQVEAVLGQNLHSAPGRHEFKLVHLLQTSNGGLTVYPVSGGSGSISALGKADGYVEIAEGRDYYRSGVILQVKTFQPNFRPKELVYMGPYDPAIYSVIQQDTDQHLRERTKVIHVSESAGLQSLLRGEAVITGVVGGDESPVDVIRQIQERLGVSDLSVVGTYHRRFGLITAKPGKSFDDLMNGMAMGHLTMVHRTQTSKNHGRIERYLRRGLGQDLSEFEVKGYNNQVSSDFVAVKMIQEGIADLTFGLEDAANSQGLHFLPLEEEYLHFVVLEANLQHPLVKVFRDIFLSLFPAP